MAATIVLIGLGWQGCHHDGRALGRSGIKGSEVGFGRWAIGGPFTDSASGGIPVGWREADEAGSAAALRRVHELGITFFDTADAHATGHSESGHVRPESI